MDAVKILVFGIVMGLFMTIANISTDSTPTLTKWNEFLNNSNFGQGASGNNETIQTMQNLTTNSTLTFHNTVKPEGSILGTVLSTWEAGMNVLNFITFIIGLYLTSFISVPTQLGTLGAGMTASFPAGAMILFGVTLFVLLFEILILLALIQILIFRRLN